MSELVERLNNSNQELKKSNDCISRQAAIDTLHMDTSIIPYQKAREYADATILEIRNRLEKLPSAQPDVPDICVGDMISRQAALQAMDTWDKFGCDPDGKLVRYDDDKHYIPYVHYEDMVHAVKHLPSAQPEIIHCEDCAKCEIDIIYHDYWCNGQKVWKTHYCGYAERRTDDLQ